MKNIIASEAKNVSKYLYTLGFMLADVMNDKEVCKKDKKWIKGIVVAILQVQSMLDIAQAFDKINKSGKHKEIKNYKE